jgi:serine protease Do
VGGLGYVFFRSAAAPAATGVPTPGAVTPAATLSLEANPEQTALRALVFVVSPVGGPNSTNASTGSGSLVDGRGYVLTNFHVIGDPVSGQLYNRQNWVLIGLNWDDPSRSPNTFYRATVVQSDHQMDLALLQVVGSENGDALPSDLSFPYLPVGNSDEVQFGDPIAVIGFPGLGGDTPTLTRGTVSGFLVDERNNLDPGWFKTDAEINPGNSGGMAINSRGELIGVPTQAFTGTDVTGKISEIRPINFARSFLDAIQ